MSNSVSFQARARTIDHLGKGQIADTPTAVSELWKNSFDAYARDVALHTFDGERKTGAVIDNGCGMTQQQLIDSWLVIGTNSKTQKKELPKADRFGLKTRITQGEKGIGRLSAAFLSPITLLITKKIDTNYSVILVDWRFFENPYLSLGDIIVPMTTVDSLEELPNAFPSLLTVLQSNLHQSEETEYGRRVQQAWTSFSEDEINSDLGVQTTESKIQEFCDGFIFDTAILKTWKVLLEKAASEDGGAHGTALLFLELSHELSLLTANEDRASDDNELKQITTSVVDTLRAFLNPFDTNSYNFSFEIKTFPVHGVEKDILRQSDTFNRDDFDALEHRVIGTVDNRGWFRGNVTAFGKDLGEVLIPPSIPVKKSGTYVGVFEIRLGTFELQKSLTTHGESEHVVLMKKAEKYGGFLIFRDSLRVLPYGRTDNDFFDIEYRRSKNAGRYFWANRRLFGQILLSTKDNKRLKDKAGREGFIQNSATRELRTLVEGLLTSLADKYFGTKSEDRKELLEIIKKEKEAKKVAQTKAKKASQKDFVVALRDQAPKLDKDYRSLTELITSFVASETSEQTLTDQLAKFDELESRRGTLKTPSKPSKLGKNEEKYRAYRDLYSEYSELIRVWRENFNKASAKLASQSPEIIAKKKFDSNQATLNALVNKYERLVSQKIDNLNSDWTKHASDDRSAYYSKAIDTLHSINSGVDLESVLNALDHIYIELSDDYTVKYNSILRALERLLDGINLDAAFSISEEEKAYFEELTTQLQALAQLGISVEVLAHELEEQDALVTRGLNSLPSEIKSHPGFQTAMNAHKSLTSQIRFLSPLKLSGYQERKTITGLDIQNHIMKFFRGRFERQRVDLTFGDDFLKISFRDVPSRIYPVFVNLINNALYWVCVNTHSKREIKLDFFKGSVVIANSGPPVDDDDAQHIFDIFYSRRVGGHGVGLYLCRENLAVANHKIRYSVENDIKIIQNGANFIIDFNGVEITE